MSSGDSLSASEWSSRCGGVSPLFVSVAVLNQAIWVTWGLLVKDPGTVMTASTVCGLTSFNLIWYVLRRFGLRALFPHETLTTPPVLAVVGSGPETVS